MVAILPRTVRRAAEAALSLRSVPPRGASHLARSLGGVSTACRNTGTASVEFVPWHNGGGILHRAASVDPTAVVEAGAVVHSGAVLGKEVVVGSGAVVGPSVSIGQSTSIGYNVVLSNCSVGEFCTIHNGASIGQDGFGFFVDEDGQVKKKPQMLYARIGDHVEIGANTCIDRGSWRETMIGDHTKIDNLVQIGHNVVIGKCCMICGQVGIAGSATLGDYVTLGGRVAIRDHVSIVAKVLFSSSVLLAFPFSFFLKGKLRGSSPQKLHFKKGRICTSREYLQGKEKVKHDNLAIELLVRLAANSTVTKDIQKPGDYGGFPAVPINEWRRQTANLRLFSKKDGVKR